MVSAVTLIGQPTFQASLESLDLGHELMVLRPNRTLRGIVQPI
jgi:hypothetical protein